MNLLMPTNPRFTLPGIGAWFDAKDPANNKTQPANAAQMAAWVDKVGGAASAVSMTQATGANKPLYATGVLNGNPGIQFDGANYDFGGSTTLRTMITRTTKHTIYLVLRASDTANSTHRTILQSGQGGAGNDMLAIGIASNILRVGYYNGSSYASKDIAFSDTSNPHILSISHAAATAPVCRLDNVLMTSTANTPQANTGDAFRLGGQSDDRVKNYNGYLGEFLIYKEDHTAAQVLFMTRVLANEWGVSIA